MELREMITRLSEAAGPSGFEAGAREIASELLRPHVDEIRTDVMGNCIALRRSKRESAPTVMLCAHMDEVGLIVTGYEGGFLRFETLGHVDERILPALEVRLLTEPPRYGVIDVLPPHLLTSEEREKPLARDRLYIDVGLDAEAVRAAVPLGTPAVYATDCVPLGAHRLSGKAMDDRSCAAILLRTMELIRDKDLPCNVAVVFSVQEELGRRGAVTAAYGVAPEAAIAVDVTFGAAPDTPAHGSFPLHAGPTVGIGPNMSRSVSDQLIRLAEDHDIPWQAEVMAGDSGTDAWPIQVSREGIATGVVSLPLRYMHTPVEVLDLRDAEAAAALLAAWLEDYGKEAEDDA